MIIAQESALDTPKFLYEWTSWDALQLNAPALFATGLGLLFVLLLTVVWHLRERHALSPLLGAWLLLLRTVAIAGVVVFLLGLQRRSVETVTRPSRVVVLVDASASMAMPAELDSSNQAPRSRAEAARDLFVDNELLEKLAETHTVTVATSDRVAASVRRSEKDSAGSTEPVAWPEFAPTAPATRLGDRINEVLDVFAGEPLAGVIVVTDGQNNAGTSASVSAASALERGTTVMTVGFGPKLARANVIVRELVAPSRAYPNDEIELTAMVEIAGEPTGNPSFSLYRRAVDSPVESDELLASKGPGDGSELNASKASGSDKQSYAVRFKTRPDQAGRYVYSVVASDLPDEAHLDDNRREAVVEVVDQTTTVLLWAGGPNRDFRFLRNQLKRDDSFVVDVLLQTASGAASQDARAVLSELPATAEELNEYDVLVAFDPDWSQVTEQQCELIEQWVSRDGAGLYFAPGQVNTPKWFQRGPTERVKRLLPVVLPDRLSLLDPSGGTRPPSQPLPMRLTRAGGSAEFLLIDNDREASEIAWQLFDGFYRVGVTSSLRPGATVYADVSDPIAGENRPVFVEQYYGAGRVFYCGVNELWRLRAHDTDYFNTLWTKLLRRLSQGRLSAGASGGRLLFERDRYELGSTLALRTLLPNRTSDDPVRAQVIPPRGEPFSLELAPSVSQPQVYAATFEANVAGRYEALVQTVDGTRLVALAEVAAPVAEREKPIRNEAALQEIALAGGGWYYPNTDAVLNGADPSPPLADAIPSREEVRTIYGKSDLEFAEQLSQILLGVIAGALLLEWLSRRLASLA